MKLQKRWVGAAKGDTATLTIDGKPVAPNQVVSTATGAADETDAVKFVEVSVPSGSTVALAESLGSGNTGSYAADLTCSAGTLDYTKPALTGSVTTPKTPTDVVCTFKNTRTEAKVKLQKRWVGAAKGDTATLTIDGKPVAPNQVVSTATGAADETDAVKFVEVSVPSGSTVALAESLGSGNTGSYAADLTCSAGTLDYTKPALTGSVTTPKTPTDVVCTFKNTRTEAKVKLQKRWVGAAKGDTATLTIDGKPVAPNQVVSTATGAADETDAVKFVEVSVPSGSTVALAESLGSGNTGSYAADLTCSAGTLDYTKPALTGSVTTPKTPTDVVCTFKNTRTEAKVKLQKRWVGAAKGDTATLTIDGKPVAPNQVVSTATGAADETDAVKFVEVSVPSGSTVALAESLGSGNTGSYAADLTCSAGTLDYTKPALTGSVTTPKTPTDVVCTFKNTRTEAKVKLQKRWVGAAKGDTATLTIDGKPVAPNQVVSTATGAADETDAVKFVEVSVPSGSTVALAESLGSGNTGSYAADLTCSAGTLDYTKPALTGSVTTPKTPTDVVCTFKNTRTEAKVKLQKRWVGAAKGDTATLTIDGKPVAPNQVVSTATGAADETDAVKFVEVSVPSGSTVALAESLGSGNTGSYAADLTCSAGTLDYTKPALTGSVTTPKTPTDVVCTFKNTRTEAKVKLQKRWVGAAKGDTATLTIDGKPVAPNQVVSTATGAADETDAVKFVEVSVPSGSTVALAESLGSGNTGSYAADLTCSAGTLDYTKPALTGSVTTPKTPTDVVCTFKNTRTQNRLTLVKEWVNGAEDDEAALSIDGGIDPASSISVSTGRSGSVVDGGNAATTDVMSGADVTVGEVLGAPNVGSYSATWVCELEEGPLSDGAGLSGSFTMPDEPVVCTITNDRTQNQVTLQKGWVNGFKGDTAKLTIAGGLTDPAGNTSTAAGDSGLQVDAAKAAETGVFSGDQVSISEILAGQGAYGSSWECVALREQPVQVFAGEGGFSAGGEGLTGSFTMPDQPVVCTFTNIRKSHEVKLQKAWVNARGGDTAALTIKGGLPESGAPTKTSTATGATGTVLDSTNVANATVQVGDTVTVTEILGASNVGKYNATLACTAGDVKVEVDDKGNFKMPDAAVTCTFTNDRSVVVPTQPTVTAEICDPNVPGAQLPGSITIPANPDYAYFIDGVATTAGTYPKPAGSYKVTAQLIVTKPVSASALQQLAAQDVYTWTVVVPGSPVCPILVKESSAGTGSVITGQTVGYSITVKNGGDTAVAGETLVDTLPAGVELITSSINPSNGVYNATARTITWKFDLPAAVGTTPATATFTYQVTVTASSGSIVNSVTWSERNLTATTTNPVEPATVGGVEETPDEPDNVVGGTEDLPKTGADNTVNVAGFGLLAMVLGGLMVGFGRRRRRE